MIIPIFVREQPRAVLVVRIDRVFRDYQRKGFFRIGLLPQMVAEGTDFEFRDPCEIENCLREARASLFALRHESAVELRKVTFRMENQTAPLLQSQSLRFDPEGRWLLTDGTLFPASSAPVQFRRATLKPSGPSAGEFCVDAGGTTIRMNVFATPP